MQLARERRRTRCVYCGERIGGSCETFRRRTPHNPTSEKRLAMRVACERHWRLPLLDHHFTEFPVH